MPVNLQKEVQTIVQGSEAFALGVEKSNWGENIG
jgi:hypothetical protein